MQFCTPFSRQRKGQTMVMFALFFALGITGLLAFVVDQGMWYQRQANIQRAADFSAIAGASMLARNKRVDANFTTAVDYAKDYAAFNGFKDGVNGVTVQASVDDTLREFTVQISRREASLFGRWLARDENGKLPKGAQGVLISARAVAEYTYTTKGQLSITGRVYGINDGPINLGLYGPDQIAERGDLYSAKFINTSNGIRTNKDYRESGYRFNVSIPENFGSSAVLQIYDPDSHDSGTDPTADGKRWDENGKDVYVPDGGDKGKKSGTNRETKTKYSLYSDGGTPNDLTDDTLIREVTIGADSSKDKKWDNTFTINLESIRSQRGPNGELINFRLQTATTSGSNENGFNLRVVQPGRTDSENDFTFRNGGNGTDITADGDIPVNFGKGGVGQVVLGYVPANAQEVRVRRFDADTGVTAGSQIQYTNSASSDVQLGQPALGGAGNNVWEVDPLTMPAGYNGATWTANYSAGSSDNTTWKLDYVGDGEQPGDVRLIR